jgi:cobalt-precorrin-5B (C1)-methyltransferase
MAEAIRLPLSEVVAEHAWRTAAQVLRGAANELEIAIFDRQGGLAGRTPFRAVG